MRGIGKTTFREIKSSFGRFLAIFGIVALGVGFFAGLKVTTGAMVETVTGYLGKHGFYDLRLVSTLGFDQENVDFFSAARDVEAAEGAISFDVLYEMGDDYMGVIKAHSPYPAVPGRFGRLHQRRCDSYRCCGHHLWGRQSRC